MPAREFDQQFEKYVKDRFKAFRDKERPVDYGRDLSPDPDSSRYTGAISIEPSPSGDLIAVATGNRRDQELDLILVSSKDGSVVRNLTSGFDMDRGFEYIATPSGSNMVPWMSWSGDRLAYFVRNEKYKTLIIQNVLNGKIERRFEIRSVDNPESPNISPDGRTVLFSGLRSATGDIFRLDLESGDITNLTNDNFGDLAPVYSQDGRVIVYLARISGSQKLFRLDVDSGKKTQLTFGTQDEAAAKFLNEDTLIFSSTATDPATPLTPEVARNGNIFNLWSLSMKTGELRQYTDALGGSAVARRAVEGQSQRQGSPSSATTRATSACTRTTSRNRCTLPRRQTSVRQGISSTFRRRCSTRWSQRTSRKRAGSKRCSSMDGRPSMSG